MCESEETARHWSSLQLIRGEQTFRITRRRGKGELPAKVYCILNASIHSLTGGRRVSMSGVSRKKEPALTEPFSEPVLQPVSRGPDNISDASVQTRVPYECVQISNWNRRAWLPEWK